MSFDLELTNNDLKISVDGSIKTVTDTPKLRQDIVKLVLTPAGSNIHHPWYGCSVGDEIIGQIMPDYIMNGQIKDSIASGLEDLKTLQSSQSTSQQVSLAEMIELVAEVYAERDLEDSRQINILITVLTKNLTKIDEMFTIIS